MTSRNILITGGSGYLGGTLLHVLSQSDIIQSKGSPEAHNLYALVRSDTQAESVKQYGAKPVSFSPHDEAAVHEAVLKYEFDIVFFLLDAMNSKSQVHFIKALGDLKAKTGRDVHFLHTTGAKIFSSHSGSPTDRPLRDTDPKLYDIQKASKAPLEVMQTAVNTNNVIIETSESHGVHSYIFAPCLVYGKGLGFGNPISIQTVAIVRAARKAKKVYKVDDGRPTWPVSHVYDTTTLYMSILQSILSGANPPSGRNGYYLAASGSVAWDDLYAGIAKALFKRGLIENETIEKADDAALEKMAAGLECPKSMVALQLGGLCTFTAERGRQIGWQSKYPAEHALESMEDEVALILESQKASLM